MAVSLNTDITDSSMAWFLDNICPIDPFASVFSPGEVIKLDDEVCIAGETICEIFPLYTGTLHLQERGIYGSIAAAHTSGTIVYKYTGGDDKMRKLKIELDGYHASPTQAIRQSDYINAKFLTAGVAETETAPAGARIVLFSRTGDFYLNTRAVAVVPTDDITDGSAPEHNPAVRLLVADETMSLIASENCVVMMAYYK